MTLVETVERVSRSVLVCVSCHHMADIPTPTAHPHCPKCGGPVRLRTEEVTPPPTPTDLRPLGCLMSGTAVGLVQLGDGASDPHTTLPGLSDEIDPTILD